MDDTQTKSSIWSNLWERRVPQIVGVYIAAWWMGIEISQWLTENFGLPETFPRLFALAMLMMLPSLIIMAYGHGAPGRDRWTKFELLFVPLNVLIAGSLITHQLMVAPTELANIQGNHVAPIATQNNDAAIRIQTITMDGEQMEFPIATEGYHRRLINFFWRNQSGDPESDWLSYGLPWLLARDLRRSPLISTTLPYDSAGIREELTKSGVTRGRSVPPALAIQIANDNNYSYAITGEFTQDDEGYIVGVNVLDPDGEIVGDQIEVSGKEIFGLVDRVTVAVRDRIGVNQQLGAANIRDLAVRDHTSDSMVAIQRLIEAKNLVAFDNNYQDAVERLAEATATDPTFADAHSELMSAHQLSGRLPAAAQAANNALKHDYKLYTEDEYFIRATLFGVQGQRDRLMQTLTLLTEIHPNSIIAHRVLSANAMVSSDLDLAEASSQAILELDPSEQSELLRLASIKIMRGDLDQAAAIQEEYLTKNERELDALFALANTEIRRGNLDAAARLYDRAALIDSNNLMGDLGLATVELRRGNPEAAKIMLDQIFARAQTPQQQVQVLTELMKLYNVTGQLREVISVAEQMDQLSASFQPPIVRAFSYGFSVAIAHAQLGDFAAAERRLEVLSGELEPPLNAYIEFGYMGIAELSGDQQRYEQALETMTEFSKTFPNPINETFLMQGSAQLAIWAGDFARSASIYHDVIDSMTRNIVNLNAIEPLEQFELRLARCLRMAGNFDQSYDRLQDLLRRFPASPDARLELAELYADQQDSVAAAEQLEQALSVWQQADSSYNRLVRALEVQEKISESG